MTSPPLYEGLPLPDRSDPQTSWPAATERDLSQEIHLAQLQNEKLTLELEVLWLRHAPGSASDNHPAQNLSGKVHVQKKVRDRLAP